MHSNKKPDNGWIVCPSRSIPGKFYYFNVATGEAVWCLSEHEKSNIKNPPLQKVDYQHCYPEPSSPPEENIPITPIQRTIHMSPYQDRMIAYPQITYPNIPNNVFISDSKPYQIAPMIWPNETNTPMAWPHSNNTPIIIFLGQGMKQIGLNEPKYRPNQDIQVWTPPQFHIPNQSSLQQVYPKDPREPDRDIFIHSGTTPLCQRFVNYKKPVVITSNTTINQPDFMNSAHFRQNQPVTNTSQNNYQQSKFHTSFKNQLPKKQDSNNNFIKGGKADAFSSQMPNCRQSGLNNKSQELIGQNSHISQQFRQNTANSYQFGQNKANPFQFGQNLANQQQMGQTTANPQQIGQYIGNPQQLRETSINAQQVGQNLDNPPQIREMSANLQHIEQNITNPQQIKQISNPQLFRLISDNSQQNGQSSEISHQYELISANSQQFRQSSAITQQIGQNLPNSQQTRQSSVNPQQYIQSSVNPQQLRYTARNPEQFGQSTDNQEQYEQITEIPQQFRHSSANLKTIGQNLSNLHQFGQNSANVQNINHSQLKQKLNFDKSPAKTLSFGEHSYVQMFEPNDNKTFFNQTNPSNKNLIQNDQTNNNCDQNHQIIVETHNNNLEVEQSQTNASYFKQHQIQEPQLCQAKQIHFEPIQTNGTLLSQPQTNEQHFEQNRLNDQHSVQYQKNEEHFEQTQTKERNLDQNQTIGQELVKSPTNKHFKHSQTRNEQYELSKTNKQQFEPSETNEQQFEQNETNEHQIEPSEAIEQQFEPSETNELQFELRETNEQNFEKNVTEYGQSQSYKTKSFNDKLSQNFTGNSPLRRSPVIARSNTFEILENVEVLSNIAMEKSNVTPDNKIKSSILSQEFNIEELDKNDLRRILIEKKRKNAILNTSNDLQSKKIKTYKEIRKISEPKKSVSFNANVEILSKSEKNMLKLKSIETEDTEITYVVTDSKTLLEEFAILEDFVKSDPKYKLIIPRSVMSDIESVARSNSRERALVTLARHLLRRLASRPEVDVEEVKPDCEDIWIDDAIFNCCIELMENADAILVSVDENLLLKAEYLGIHCVPIENIKNDPAKKQKVFFDVEKSTNEMRTKFGSDDSDKFRDKRSSPIENTLETQKSENFLKSPILTKNVRDPRNYKFHESTFNNNDILNSNESKVQNNGSKIEIDGIEKLTQISSQNNSKSKTRLQDDGTNQQSIFENNSTLKSEEDFENKVIYSIFHVETKNQNPENKESSIFESEEIKKSNYFGEFLKKFYEKYKNLEKVVETRRDDVACNFTQILEDCLNDILQEKPNLLTLPEALQLLQQSYNHTYIRDVVAVFTSVLDAKGAVPARDVIKTVGCGFALVKYLMFVIPASESIKDADNNLSSMIRHLLEDGDVAPNEPAPTPSADTRDNVVNFVRDRLYVVKYLKKHFPAWADYDETLEDNTTLNWGNETAETGLVVRTYGKNLNKLQLNMSKPMTMQTNSTSNINRNMIKNEPNNNRVESKNNNSNIGDKQDAMENNSKENFDSPKMTRLTKNVTAEYLHLDVQNSTDQNFNDKNLETIAENAASKENIDLKMTRFIKNDVAKNRSIDTQDLSIDPNSFSKQIEPKLIRTFNNNINVKKENINKDIFQNINFTISGHSFGVKENGPKILRNIAPIKEFEDKCKQKNVDFSSNPLYTQSIASESTNDRLTIHIENDGKNENPKNDRRNDPTNDCSDNMKLNSMYDYEMDIFQTNEMISNNFEADFANDRNDNLFTDAMGLQGMNYEFETNDDWINDLIKDDNPMNDSEHAYYLVDNFLNELKVTFKAIHEFIGNSVRQLGDSELSVSQHPTIIATAKDARAHLKTILDNLNGIRERESSQGPKLRNLTAGAGSKSANDERIRNYRELVTKCYDHGRLIYKALQTLLFVTNDNK